MRSLGWTLIQYDRCPYKTRKMPCEASVNTHRETVMWQQRQSLGDATQATSEARKSWGSVLPQSFRGSVTFVVRHLVTVSTLCLTLYDPVDCSLPCSSVHGISQARVLEWVAISFSRGSSLPDPEIKLLSPVLAGGFFSIKPPGKPSVYFGYFFKVQF